MRTSRIDYKSCKWFCRENTKRKKATHNDFDMKMQGEKKPSTHILGNVKKDRKHINIRCKAKKGKERKKHTKPK